MSAENRGDSTKTRARRWRRWKAAAAVLAGCGALLWHMLACVEGPMAFSPDGDLAFVTVSPLPTPGAEEGEKDQEGASKEGVKGEESRAAEGEVCRLFVLPKGEKTLRVVEQTAEHMLCAPGYSPDGKSLCYLRLPAEKPKSGQPSESATKEDRGEESPPVELVSSKGCQVEDLALPPISELQQFVDDVRDQPWIEATLVVRDAASADVRSTTTMNLRLNEAEKDAAAWTYAFGRAEYSPDGDWIYVCVPPLLLAVNPGEKQLRLLAAQAWWASLSPDGKAVATIAGEREIGIVATDAERALYARLGPGITLAPGKGCAWLDNETLAVLATRGEKKLPLAVLVRRDGTIAREIELPIEKGEYLEDLAVAPDGRRIAIAVEGTLYVLDAQGRAVSQWTAKGLTASSPTFSPDSKQLACKLVREDDETGCTAIAFFSADGKEQFQVPIPQAEKCSR
jgi:hypothetical protein